MMNSFLIASEKRASTSQESLATEAHKVNDETKYLCLVVDDRASSLEKLRVFLEHSENFELMQQIRSDVDILAAVRRKKPDVLLINLDSVQGSVKDLLSSLRNDRYAPVIVFVGSSSDFAAEAFELEASDYLPRPLTLERIAISFKRIREQLDLRRMNAEVQDDAPKKISPAFRDELLLKTRGRIVFAHPSEIKYISAERNYVRFHLRSESILIRRTMSHLALLLDPKVFVRIHRSTIVNIRFVKELRPWSALGRGNVVLKDGTVLPAGRTYMTEMLKSVEFR